MPQFETFFNRAVKDYMRKKFYILKGDDTVASAVKVMKENSLGSVGVQFGGGQVGIVTDRDIVMKVVSVSGDPMKVKLQDIAVRNPVTISQDASLEEAFKLMRDNVILRLIVLDGKNKAVGLLVERWVFASFVSEVLGEKRKEPHGWLERYVRDVTDAALMED
jgi:acetoin utilization protein AcuB